MPKAETKKVTVFPTAESGFQQEEYQINEDIEMDDGAITITTTDGKEVTWFEHAVVKVEIE